MAIFLPTTTCNTNTNELLNNNNKQHGKLVYTQYSILIDRNPYLTGNKGKEVLKVSEDYPPGLILKVPKLSMKPYG